jgi:prepilin-type N-terminal cleavage/methylation domain-containing protein
METIRIKARSGSAGAASLSRPIKARRGSAGTPPVSVKARSGSAGTASLSRPIKARSGSDGTAPTLAVTPRSAFTLVELLVVIGIIAMLAALVTPAVMRAQATARNAAIKAEIDMLHMAIMNYKNEYGSFPPGSDVDLLPASPAGKHIQRLFPRCLTTNIRAQLLGGFPSSASPTTIVYSNALSYWLLGFTTDPSSPLSPNTARQKLYDFDQSRVNSVSGKYSPADKPGSPYIYIPASQYDLVPYTAALITSGGVGSQFTPPAPSPTALPSSSIQWFTNLGLSGSQQQTYANPDTFQILCAGRDEVFGNDDDLSNFWPGTRKDYLDSLNK